MKKNIRRLVAATLSSVLLFSAVSCSTGSKSGKMGRYVEERHELPEGVSYIQTLTKLDNGSTVMIANDKEGHMVKYASEDGGETWTQGVINQPQVEGKEVAMGQPVILNDGRIFTSYSLYEPYVEEDKDQTGDDDIATDKEEYTPPESKYIIIDTNGNIQDLDISFAEESNDELGYKGEPYMFLAASNGDIFYQNSNGDAVVQIDGQTFKEKYRYQANDWINNFFIVGDSLVVWENSAITQYDINTGKDKGNLEKLEKETIKGDMQYYPRGINTTSKDKIYYYSILGLYSYDINTNENKMLVDGALSSFGSTENNLVAFVEKEDNQFLAVFNDWNSGSCDLINYTYNPDIPSVPDDQLRVYSLIESNTIRQAISSFSKNNPDIYVKYEVGLSWGDGVTANDAIKTLNTEIMSGKGPDIILLDNLSADSYIQKGLLEDISDIIGEYVDNGEIFKGMAEAYTIDDKIYQFPTTFTLPMMVGERETINKVNDLDSFASVVTDLASKSDNRILDNVYDTKSFIYSLYYLYENNWLNDDKTINEENLTKFMEVAKEMFVTAKEKNELYLQKMQESSDKGTVDNGFGVEDNMEVYPDKDFTDDESKGEEEYVEDPNMSIYNLTYSLMPGAYVNGLMWDGEPVQLIYGGLGDTWNISSLVSVLLNNKNMEYRILPKGSENIFVPLENVGVNSKSENKDIAKSFVKELLSEKVQSSGWKQGLPINKKALESQIKANNEIYEGSEFDKDTNRYVMGYSSMTDQNGNEKTIKQYYLNDDDISRLMSEIDKVNVAPTLNTTLLIEVANQFDAYVNGTVTVDEAVGKVVDNLDLYLAE